MAGVNKVILIGNLGKDPEVRYLEGGAAVANFPIATTESYKDKSGNRVDHTEWHNIVLWRGLAEVAEKYLRKGMQVYIEGKLRTRSWQDKEGQKRYTTEVIADTMTILTKKEDSQNLQNQQQHHQPAQQNPQTPVQNPETSPDFGSGTMEDDLPF